MFDKLEIAEGKYEELSHKVSDPSVIADHDEYRKLMKEISDLDSIVRKYREYKKYRQELADSREILESESDKELLEMAQEEIESVRAKLALSEDELKLLLIPKDPHDEKSVIMEIRGGAGGEEAALFAGVLFRMYSMYAEKKGWQVEILDSNPTEIGGFKEIVFLIEAKGAYSRLKYESGVHRVQRVPATEASGRIHTSTVTVAVLPEVEEVDVDIDPSDLRIDVYRSSGAGGQHVNKTSSAIRITHLPSGIVVTCQDERSQYKNKDRAMSILRSKLYDIARQERTAGIENDRRSQVGTGDRSERIRTYNYPQGRVTDHRINLTLYRLESILNGDIDEIADALISEEQARKLAGESN
ncbi:MAG: peptide chain release factor 1 [Eubacteriales bacterium]|nr:peptide chain release factor 1 [Eubacteriales bacterium]